MYKSVIFILILILCLSAFNSVRCETKKYDQTYIIDSSYYYSSPLTNNFEITSHENNGLTIRKTMSKDSILVAADYLKNVGETMHILESRKYLPNGNLESIIFWGKDPSHMRVFAFYQDGTLKRDDNYVRGALASGVCYDSCGNRVDHFDYMSQPNVDINAYSRCLRFPDDLKRKGYEETIILKLFVSKSGKICAFQYDGDHSKEFIQSAINCLELLSDKKTHLAKPCMIENEPIDSWLYMPIKFRLR